MVHALKCEHDFFEDTVAGRKPYEVRLKDRPYRVGDYVALNEIGNAADLMVEEDMRIADGEWGYTGRCALSRIVGILDDPRFVKEGYCILGLVPVEMVCKANRALYDEAIHGWA